MHPGLKQFLSTTRNIIALLLTSCINIHSPKGTTMEAMISRTFPIALALIHDGVHWGWIVSAEAFLPVLAPGVGIALVLLDAPSYAPGRGVVPWLPQVLWQQARIPILDALPVPSEAWICSIIIIISSKNLYVPDRGERIVFWWPNTNTNTIRLFKNDRIRIRILFGFSKMTEYE